MTNNEIILKAAEELAKMELSKQRNYTQDWKMETRT